MNNKPYKKLLIVSLIVLFFSFVIFIILIIPNEKTNDFSNQSSSNSDIKEDIDGYEYADFHKLNSYASQDGIINTPVYVKGKVKDILDFDEECGITLKSEDDEEWLIIFEKVRYSTELFKLLNNQDVLCFGEVICFPESFSMPVFYADKIEIGKKANKSTYSLSKLKTISEESLSYNESEETTELLTEPVTEPKTEPPTEAPTIPPTEPPTEAPTEKTYPVIFTSDEIEISYFDAKKSKYEDDVLEVYLLVNNKTDRSLTFQADTIILNGISYNNVVMSDPISPGTKGTINATVQEMMIIPETITSVGGELRYFDSNSFLSDDSNRHYISILETQI